MGTIIIGFGANLYFGEDSPRETIEKAMLDLNAAGLSITQKSDYYQTVPVPNTGQPDFVNCVAVASSDMGAADAMTLAYETELKYGRDRSEKAVRWDARTLDIDLLDCDGHVLPSKADWLKRADEDGSQSLQSLTLPHPRAHQRVFVLRPLADLVPNWQHPVLGLTAKDLQAQHLAQHPEDAKNMKKLPE